MNLNMYRYNKEFYLFDGRLPSNVLEIISLFEIKKVNKKIEIDGCCIITPLFIISTKDIEDLKKICKTLKKKNRIIFY